MMDNGESKDDLAVPDDDIGREVQEKFNNGESFAVTVLKACGEEKIIATKVLN